MTPSCVTSQTQQIWLGASQAAYAAACSHVVTPSAWKYLGALQGNTIDARDGDVHSQKVPVIFANGDYMVVAVVHVKID